MFLCRPARPFFLAVALLAGPPAGAQAIPACRDLLPAFAPADPIPARFSVAPTPSAPGPLSATALAGLAAYRNFLTRADGASCRFYPTCAGMPSRSSGSGTLRWRCS